MPVQRTSRNTDRLNDLLERKTNHSSIFTRPTHSKWHSKTANDANFMHVWEAGVTTHSSASSFWAKYTNNPDDDDWWWEENGKEVYCFHSPTPWHSWLEWFSAAFIGSANCRRRNFSLANKWHAQPAIWSVCQCAYIGQCAIPHQGNLLLDRLLIKLSSMEVSLEHRTQVPGNAIEKSTDNVF